MTIAVLIRTLRKGGAEKQSVLLAEVLSNKFKIIMFVQDLCDAEKLYIERLERNNIEIINLSGNLFKRVFLLNKQVRKHSINLIFSYLTKDNFLASIVKILNRKIKAIGGIRNSHLPKAKFIINRFLHNHLLDYTIFNNQSGMKFLIQKGYKPNKCHTIFNCIDYKENPKDRFNSEEIKILTVGRFVEQKDYFTALRAFSRLQQLIDKVSVKYIIVGYGQLEEQIREFINGEGIQNIEIVINPPDVNNYYQDSDIFLSTSIFEGFPNVIMEALNSSLPVVATDVGDTSQLVCDGKNGYLTKVYNYKSLSEKLQILVEDVSKRKGFGKEGYHLLHEKFSLKRFEQEYLDFINKIIS